MQKIDVRKIRKMTKLKCIIFFSQRFYSLLRFLIVRFINGDWRKSVNRQSDFRIITNFYSFALRIMFEILTSQQQI